MHILLPPSEAKRPGGRGRPLRDRAPHPVSAVAGAREQALAALGVLVGGDPQRAAAALALPPAVRTAALAADAAVLDAPTMPALRRYRGIVYEGLAHDAMTPAEQHVAARSVLIFSGLFGVLGGGEAVPDYRVPAKAALPGLGIAATFWRPVLVDVLPGRLRRGLVVDLRSSDYAAMWRPEPGRVVAVRVLSPAPRGGLAVISHPSKLAKGRLAAALVRRAAAGCPVTGPDDVVAAWADAGGAGAEQHANGLDLITG